ncbi:MAG: hypothetical protein WCK67_06525 [bacterium]
MINYSDNITFNPGFSKFSQDLPFDLLEHIENLKQRTPKHKIKFELSRLIPHIGKSIDIIASVYAGCMLWGTFLNLYFQDNPIKITGNPVEELSEDQKKELDYTEEPKFLLNLMQSVEKDSKFFLNKHFTVHPKVKEILEAYEDFAQINNNFTETSFTNDIKLVSYLQKYKSFSKEELETLHDKIKNAINNNNIAELLELI